MASIALESVAKTFSGHAAVRELSLDIADGELMTLVGPSGCGKSTVLRLIAGLEQPSTGRVLIGGRDVTGLPPQQRDLAMVFQSYALYPHLTVRDNLSFGLRMRGAARVEIAPRVAHAAALLGIDGLLDRKPAQLSGGQRQRVALGRAIVREPQAFLLDEPLSNLDPALRLDTRAQLALLHRRPPCHDGVCDARSGGGDDARHADGGDERRPPGTDRHATGDLRASRQYLRRAVRGIAGHESRRRRRRGVARRAGGAVRPAGGGAAGHPAARHHARSAGIGRRGRQRSGPDR